MLHAVLKWPLPAPLTVTIKKHKTSGNAKLLPTPAGGPEVELQGHSSLLHKPEVAKSFSWKCEFLSWLHRLPDSYRLGRSERDWTTQSTASWSLKVLLTACHSELSRQEEGVGVSSRCRVIMALSIRKQPDHLGQPSAGVNSKSPGK